MAVLPFEGVYVPPVTPFLAGAVDELSLRKLVDYLIGSGATGLVPCGTTGESPTLSHVEHLKVVEVVIDQAGGRVPVIAGAGSNSTAEAIGLAQGAEGLGADGLLMVSPYYNRPSQDGIVAHFTAVAKSTTLPIIIYNIPFRTGREVEPTTIIELSKQPNFRGLKQSTGEITAAQTIIQGTGDDFSVMTGDDELLFVLSCLGGRGAVLASGHFEPKRFLAIHEHVKAGRIDEARALHYELLPLVKSCFAEPNPAPIKAGLKLMGIIESDEVRLPMTVASQATRERMRGDLAKLGML